jgi:drug/metabolite transporter (DMT)-like permease
MSWPLGETLALLSAAAFALANLTIKRTETSRGDKGVLFSVVVTMGMSLALFLLLEAGRAKLPATPATAAGLGWFALAGVSAMVIGRTFVFASIRELGIARASAVKRLNPVFSVFLAVLFLAERLSGVDLVGIGAIGAALAILARETLRRTRESEPPLNAYLPGVTAAFAYAVSYIARKLGLAAAGAPAFGTFLSALAGFLCFALLAAVWPRYRHSFAGMFRHLDRWIVLSAVLISAGQILMFAALAHAPVSTVVMISSLEVFLSILLASFLFRIEARPSGPILAAAGLATGGAILLAAG